MILDMFSVYDSKAKTFCTPFYCPNISTAMRSFEYAANDNNTDVGRYPSDFALFHFGTFNDETCETDLVTPYQLALAVTLVKQPEVNSNVV